MKPISHHARLLLVMTAQVVLSVVFCGGYFLILYLFISGHVKPPSDYKEMIMTLIGVLTAGVGQVLSFWFARQREATTPPTATSP